MAAFISAGLDPGPIFVVADLLQNLFISLSMDLSMCGKVDPFCFVPLVKNTNSASLRNNLVPATILRDGFRALEPERQKPNVLSERNS